MCPRNWASRRDLRASAGSQTATCALNANGDEIEGGEDDEIESGGDRTVALTVLHDKLAEDVVECRAVKTWGYHKVSLNR